MSYCVRVNEIIHAFKILPYHDNEIDFHIKCHLEFLKRSIIDSFSNVKYDRMKFIYSKLEKTFNQDYHNEMSKKIQTTCVSISIVSFFYILFLFPTPNGTLNY
jgi:hypothetical protein